ncbi:hypothetical protein N7536_007048 [Penicillium majusculum]|uniref:Uncharacterized protein n=1 Tax=Penicillium solitum TaxID=60172 RepID=A0A1V6RKB9_9EURO|nr:uncharacterized protein PENSOL_c002G03216 [Penicillium solitum]KAJ5696636.1 hypothetical protein N7536_007048 [Penicillium majusculum]OQE02257.1 hypothetical protein PENSOL_c002G03216 [Penicillium solitum]
MAPAANKSKAKGKEPDQASAKLKLRLNVKAPIKAEIEVSEETRGFIHNLTISTNEYTFTMAPITSNDKGKNDKGKESIKAPAKVLRPAMRNFLVPSGSPEYHKGWLLPLDKQTQ